VDPFDRYLRRPLDELLVTQGVLTRPKADELVASALEAGEPFCSALLDAAVLTPWDLARLVAVHYQMPAHPLAGYKFEKELFAGLAPEILHRYLAVPLAVFGRTRTFAVAEPPSRELLDALTSTLGTSLFFFIAEAPEIRRVLADHVKVIDAVADTSWQRMFDSAEAEVSKTMQNGS